MNHPIRLKFAKETQRTPETDWTLFYNWVEKEIEKTRLEAYKEGVKTATCDIRNSLNNIEKQNGL